MGEDADRVYDELGEAAFGALAGYWTRRRGARRFEVLHNEQVVRPAATERKRSALRAEAASARDQLRRAEEALRRLERLPLVDPCADGEVLLWTKRFPSSGGAAYTYVALRTGGRWFTTAKRAGARDARAPLSWTDLYEVMNQGGYVESMFRMARGERLV